VQSAGRFLELVSKEVSHVEATLYEDDVMMSGDELPVGDIVTAI
jgi:hypothetical protein